MFTNKKVIIGGIVTLLMVLVALALVPKAHSESVTVPQEAWDMAKMIQAKSARHAEEQKALQPILDKIAKLEAERDRKLGDMSKIAGGAAGLDHSLCSEFGLKYVRGEGTKLGKFINVTEDCPLE